MPPRDLLPITVIIPTRNEAANLAPCLRSLRGVGQVIVVDSHSTDATADNARRFGAEVHTFDYAGGWPKKRQWAMDTLDIRHRWTLLLDADERLTGALRHELAEIVRHDGPVDGYWINLRLVFLGRVLKHGASNLRKLSFFRTGKGRFECLIADQTAQMSDVEIHEHVVLEGRESDCRGYLLHENVNSLFRYIEKHNEYSTWSAELALRHRDGRGPDGAVRKPRLLGSQADRRRWLMNRLWRLPLAGVLLPLLRFLYFYFGRFGFLDGQAGFYYCGFKAVQSFHIMAKVEEAAARKRRRR